MLSFFFYLFIFCLAMVEATLWPLNFEAMILAIWILSGSRLVKNGLLLPFLLGLIFDLVLLRPLGVSSLFLVAAAFASRICTERIDLGGRYFLIIFLPVLSFLFSKLIGKNWSLNQAFFEVLLSWFLWPWLTSFFEGVEEGKQLRLRI